MTNLNALNYVTVTDKDIQAAGAVVFWRLAGAVNLEDLTAAWTGSGFDPDMLPANPTPTVALQRSMQEIKDAAHIVRNLPGGGLALVREYKAERDLAYDVVLRATVDKVGRIKVEVDQAFAEDQAYLNLAERAKGSYQFHLVTLGTTDISTWLTSLMAKLQAVSLREMGGIYFVPRFNLANFERMVGCIREVSSSVVSFIPAMPTSEALDAITEAISNEAVAMIEGVEKDITEGTLGERALKSRAKLAEECERKVTQYEGILGKRLTDIHENLEVLRERVNQALLSAEAAELLKDA